METTLWPYIYSGLLSLIAFLTGAMGFLVKSYFERLNASIQTIHGDLTIVSATLTRHLEQHGKE